MAVQVEPLYAAEAKARMLAGKRADPEADLPQGSRQSKRAPQARDQAAATAGTSGRSVAQFKRLAEQAPDLASQVQSGGMSLDRAERIVRDREAQARRVEQARREAAAEPVPARLDIRTSGLIATR